MSSAEDYTASIDAALTLYQTRPETCSTNPIDVVIDALLANKEPTP